MRLTCGERQAFPSGGQRAPESDPTGGERTQIKLKIRSRMFVVNNKDGLSAQRKVVAVFDSEYRCRGTSSAKQLEKMWFLSLDSCSYQIKQYG